MLGVWACWGLTACGPGAICPGLNQLFSNTQLLGRLDMPVQQAWIHASYLQTRSPSLSLRAPSAPASTLCSMARAEFLHRCCPASTPTGGVRCPKRHAHAHASSAQCSPGNWPTPMRRTHTSAALMFASNTTGAAAQLKLRQSGRSPASQHAYQAFWFATKLQMFVEQRGTVSGMRHWPGRQAVPKATAAHLDMASNLEHAGSTLMHQRCQQAARQHSKRWESHRSFSVRFAGS